MDYYTSEKGEKRDGTSEGGREWTGNYFEFSTFEWQPRPIDYY